MFQLEVETVHKLGSLLNPSQYIRFKIFCLHILENCLLGASVCMRERCSHGGAMKVREGVERQGRGRTGLMGFVKVGPRDKWA